jgi:hypothetical protein
VPPQEQNLGSIYQYADAQNADLFYMKPNDTLDLSVLVNGGSGSSRPAKQAKPPPRQPQKFFIYVYGPDQHQNTVQVLPSDRIRRVKELIEHRVDLQPSLQTMFLNDDQLDDNTILEDRDITQGTTLQLLRANPSKNCEEHGKPRNAEHLMQKYDPFLNKWIWVCCPGVICRTQGPSQNSVGAATSALTQHSVPLRAQRTPKHFKKDTAAAETPSGSQLQTPLPDTSTPHGVGTRVYARFGDGEEYPATILGSYTGGHLVVYDIEPEATCRVVNAHIKPIPTFVTSVPPAPDKVMCGLHQKPRGISNLKWQINPHTKVSQMICKPGHECVPRPERLDNAEHYGPHAGSDTATNQNNLEVGTDDTSSTSSWDETSKQRLSVSAKTTVTDRQQRGKTLIETKASTVLRTAPSKPACASPASVPAPISRARVRQVAPLHNNDFSAGMDERRVHPQQKGPRDEHFSLRELTTGKQVGNLLNSPASNATTIEGSQQPPPFSQDPATQLEPNKWIEALGQLASLNLTVNDSSSQLTPHQESLEPTLPPESAPNLPLPLTAAPDIEFFVHGAGYSLDFRRSLDLRIGQLKLEVSHRISTPGAQIPATEIALAFKGKIMEDAAALREYNLQQNALNIIDLTVSMRGAATPSNAPHTPPPSEETLPTDVAPGLPSVITAKDHTSSSEDTASPPEPEQTTTSTTFCGKILDEYSSVVLQPELSAVITAMTQLSSMAPQRVQMPQRQVMWAPKDQLINAPLQPTPPPLELDNDVGLEEPDELTQPLTGMGKPQTETMIPVPHAHEPPPQGVLIDTPTTSTSTFTVLVTGPGDDLSFILSPDTTIAFLKQAIQMATGVSASRQVLSSQGKEMHGSETLRDHNVTPSSNIDLTIKLIQFSVSTPDGSSITMLDSIDGTGGQLKARLEVKTGVLAAHQILTYTEEIQDSTTLREISLPAKGTIHMSLRLIGSAEKERTPTPTQPQKMDSERVQFFVQNLNGSSLTMRESYDTTGGQLKARLQIRTGIPAAQQRLTYTSDIQDLATLREIALPENGTIRIFLRLFGGMEEATGTRQIRCDTIYARGIGISVTHTPLGYEITDIAEDSPADKEERISRGLLLVKIGDSLDNLRDLDRVGKTINGTPNTPVELLLKTKHSSRPFQVSLVRQQSHPSGPTIDAGGESPRSPLHLSRPTRARQIQSPYDTSPSPANLTQRLGKESQLPSQDQAYIRALRDSIHSLLLSGGQPKNGYVSQRQLAGNFYHELRHMGTGAEIKQRLHAQDEHQSPPHPYFERTNQSSDRH